MAYMIMKEKMFRKNSLKAVEHVINIKFLKYLFGKILVSIIR